MGFQHGVGGINAASKQLDVIGNNVANAGTIGFKGSRAEFSDMYAANFYGVAATQTGLGVKTETIAQQFSQGNINTTGNQMDMAISGNGFFILNDPNGVSYTRNGQFKINREGYIVNNSGANLRGASIDAATGKVLPGNEVNLRVDNSQLDPRPTDYPSGAGKVELAVNLDSRENPIPITTPFALPVTTDMYNHTTSTTVYNSLGNPLVLNVYYIKTATLGEWSVRATITDPKRDTNITATPTNSPSNPRLLTSTSSNITFDTAGKLTTTTPITFAPYTPHTGVNAEPLVINLDSARSTQFGDKFAVNSIIQPGYPTSVITNLEVSKEGIITARYSNGQNKSIGQVMLANFANQQGLQPIGNNRWIQTYQSGSPTKNQPGSTNTGLIQAQALEDANIDLTAELVNMITAQRFYQANAQTIKVQDAVLQSVINLR